MADTGVKISRSDSPLHRLRIRTRLPRRTYFTARGLQSIRTMPPQIKKDLNRSGWETTDFPSVCENCLPENPYVKMLKEDYGAECKMVSRRLFWSLYFLSRLTSSRLVHTSVYRLRLVRQPCSRSKANDEHLSDLRALEELLSVLHARSLLRSADCRS